MRRTGTTLWLSVFLILGLVLVACAPATPEVMPTDTPIPTEAEATDTPEPEASQPSVTVSDQDASDGNVVVEMAVAAEPGWMVIHADQDGQPGPVIGHAPVSQGSNQNVEITIDLGNVTERLHAMLHLDTGVEGEYEFPDGDPPVRVDDQIVVEPFEVSLPAAGMSIGTRETSLGPALTGTRGFSVYILTADSPGRSTCDTRCAQFWPPVTTQGMPQAGEGVDASLLGTLTRDDGSTQVTYNGWPLYYFAEDEQAGDTNGQGISGFGGTWYIIGPEGEPIRQTGGGIYDY